jgi:hypothetical protein
MGLGGYENSTGLTHSLYTLERGHGDANWAK